MKIGIVGGSDYSKIAEQLGEGDDGEPSSSSFRCVLYHSSSRSAMHDLTLFIFHFCLIWTPVHREWSRDSMVLGNNLGFRP